MAGGLQSDAILSVETAEYQTRGAGSQGLLAPLTRGLFRISSLALLAAAVVLTYGVAMAHATGMAVPWQDEVTIFLIGGAVFLSAAEVQRVRGHIGIDLLSGVLPERAETLRRLTIDGASFCFCTVFAWKSWALLHEALAEGQTSESAWGPPLWIPYSLLTAGMATLALTLAVQIRERSLALLIALSGLLAGFLAWHDGMLPALLQAAGLVVAPGSWKPPTGPLLPGVSPGVLGVGYCVATLIFMFSGMPIAFALGTVALVFMLLFMPHASLDTVAQNVYQELANVIILAIPLFILKGAAIGRSNAGKDLYSALHAWMNRIPGGLGVANTVACGLFAAMAGSSPATCSAIGSAGIPEMRARGYSPGFAAGIIAAGGTLGILLPPSVTMLLYAVAAEVSLGKLFLAGIGPGLLLITLFAIYSVLRFSHEKRMALAESEAGGATSAILNEDRYTWVQKLRMLAWVLPFVSVLAGVMVVLYAGLASPSETAGIGAVLALVVIGAMYGIWRPSKLMPILQATLRESTMLLTIIGMSLLYSYVMSYLHISQGAAEWIVSLHPQPWVLLAAILAFVVVLGFFLPPVSIILMTAPIILPPLKAAGFNLVWFGVVMTIVMEMGLIHPPVGLNIFVIRNIAPDIPLNKIIWGTLPFVVLMMIAVVLLCVVPGIAMWLPTLIKG